MNEVRFEFASEVPTEAIEDMLRVATAALDGLFGSAAVALEASCRVENDALCVDVGSRIGAALARVLHGLLDHSLGPRGFVVRRTDRAAQAA